MPRRTKRGQGPGTRGRHKKNRSRETRLWNRLFLKKSLKEDKA